MGLHTLDTTNNLISLAEALQYCGIDPGTQEQTQVQCVADVAGSLGGTYFLLSSTTVNYYVWIDVANGSADPAVSGATGIEVDIASGASASAVALAVVTAVEAHSAFSATQNGVAAVITADTGGLCTDASAGTSGFTVTTLVQGTAQDATYDDIMTRLINEMSVELNERTQRDIKSRAQTEYYTARHPYVLYLKNPPIATLVLYQDVDYSFGATTVITSTDYNLDDQTGRVELIGDAFLSDVRAIKATYTGGWSTIPADVKGACLRMVERGFLENIHKSQTVTSRGGEESATYNKAEDESVLRVVRRYRLGIGIL